MVPAVIDISSFTGVAGELAVAIPLVGAAVVTTYALAKAFPFIMGWISKGFKAARG